ncbi:hypothetical protein F383_24312 [Gossypium arboreum]|uniref:Uncharacterized protein n=1 Tax=Gossypium arboreum TaxID=29729 RepID=A0A0B0MRV3_GOSAR|nr:hypothetical protein F383_24312 [Gossypium arboreum]
MHLWQGSLHRRKYSCSAASTSSSWSGSLNSIVFVSENGSSYGGGADVDGAAYWITLKI